ncbi:hypothetical protein HN924_03505 [Candidatus Woesearchaeota archaeon]|jgi:hypothetical protein|nr:hypothetical protein [Candidatus Woesearchaeota archaeon]MBT7063007.1 hypothetical protein [Candidatus Woesearchaeota archaeon]MBT7402590.1 hypothetical protein [Candidatus Woesearchaeota archaeon]
MAIARIIRHKIIATNGGFSHTTYNPTDIASLSRKVLIPEITEELGEEIETHPDKPFKERDGRNFF